MAKSKEPKYDDKKQSKRFIDKAKELETDKSGRKFSKAVGNIAKSKDDPKQESS